MTCIHNCKHQRLRTKPICWHWCSRSGLTRNLPADCVDVNVAVVHWRCFVLLEPQTSQTNTLTLDKNVKLELKISILIYCWLGCRQIHSNDNLNMKRWKCVPTSFKHNVITYIMYTPVNNKYLRMELICWLIFKIVWREYVGMLLSTLRCYIEDVLFLMWQTNTLKYWVQNVGLNQVPRFSNKWVSSFTKSDLWLQTCSVPAWPWGWADSGMSLKRTQCKFSNQPRQTIIRNSQFMKDTAQLCWELFCCALTCWDNIICAKVSTARSWRWTCRGLCVNHTGWCLRSPANDRAVTWLRFRWQRLSKPANKVWTEYVCRLGRAHVWSPKDGYGWFCSRLRVAMQAETKTEYMTAHWRNVIQISVGKYSLQTHTASWWSWKVRSSWPIRWWSCLWRANVFLEDVFSVHAIRERAPVKTHSDEETISVNSIMTGFP